MKTAEEWWNEFKMDGVTSARFDVTFDSIVKQIQLDAYKAGMTEAAEIAGKSQGPIESTPMQSASDYQCAAIRAKDAILTARDNKTSL